MNQYPVMPGVKRQAIGVHCGRYIEDYQPIAMDRRDYPDDEYKFDLPHEFICTHLVHLTDNNFAESIGFSDPNDFIFMPRQVPITNSQSFRLTWWSPLPPKDWRRVIANNLPDVDTEYYDIGNSAAFKGNSLCGPMGIAVKWHDILLEYAKSRQKTVADIEFRALGTFLYSREIMFAVLVCMRGDTGVGSVPLINANGTEAFVPRSQADFIWRVYSTVGYHGNGPGGVFWSWDHVSFGFHCPTSNLSIRNRFCGIVTKKATSYKPMTRSDGNNRTVQETYADVDLLDRLTEKITSSRLEIAEFFRST